MKTLQFEVDGQYISRKDNLVPVAKCRNLYKAHFEFLSPEWEGTKTAIFSQRSYSKAQVLDEKNECAIPWEFFDTDIDIRGTVSVFCGDLVTTNNAYVSIEKTGYKDSDASVPPTSDVYQQILERLDQVSGLTPEDLAKAVEEYLAKNPIELTPIDKTLTKEGQASDAKATGDRLKEKIDKNQGAENNGKILGIGADGMVALVEKPSGGGDGIPIINTMSGASPLVVTDSAERVNKGMSIIGNTVQKQDPPPSPSNPQEIKNVGKWNEETQKYEIDVILNGGNLWNKDSGIRGHIDNNTGETVQHETDVSFVYTVIVPIDGKYTVRVEEENAYGSYFTAVFNDEYYSPYIRISPGSKGILTLKKGKNKIQVAGLDSMNNKHSEKITLFYGDNEPSTYESYREPQTLTLTSDRPITKWDKLVEQDGQIGWLYGSKQYIITGNENFENRDGYDIEKFSNRYFTNPDILYSVSDQLVASKQFRWVKYVYAPNIMEEGITNNINQIHIKLSNDRLGITDSDSKETRNKKYTDYIKKLYESGTPITVMFKANTEQFIPLKQDQQDAIRALTTYYPTTVVTVDGGEVIPSVELTYTADTKNYIDGKIASYHAMAQANQIAMMSLLPDETQATMIEKDQENLLGGI
ncbi:hypothetical protein [Dorea phocaeensis]|uniref:hypothetical protein n=1 Tax=Dorea phocaeensis TaxID=2040291 RepID=UPI000C75C20C|nr:hypothetical protein [Dorea phocaeensis]